VPSAEQISGEMMGNKVEYLNFGEHHRVSFRCPGCRDHHALPVDGDSSEHPVWLWNGDLEKPTLTPSILVRTGHYVPSHTGESCWCTYNAEHPEKKPVFACGVCHSFVTDGRIQFLDDCTHVLAGQTVDLPEIQGD
jgi:hypothetical protein